MQMKWSLKKNKWLLWGIHIFFLAAKQVLKSSDSQLICKLERQSRGRYKICLGWKKALFFKIAAKYTDHKSHTNLACYYGSCISLNGENLEPLWCLTAVRSQYESLRAHSINQRWRTYWTPSKFSSAVDLPWTSTLDGQLRKNPISAPSLCDFAALRPKSTLNVNVCAAC